MIDNPDGATLNFNTGPCPLGRCAIPRGCAAIQVEMETVTSKSVFGSVFRRSVGIEIRGN